MFLLSLSLMVLIFFGHSKIDIQLHDTYIVVSLYQLFFLLTFFLGLLTALYYLIPKLIKKNLNRVWSKIHFLITTIAIACVLATLFIISMSRVPSRYYNFEGNDTMSQSGELINFLFLSLGIVFISQLIFIINIFYSILKGPKIPTDFNDEYL